MPCLFGTAFSLGIDRMREACMSSEDRIILHNMVFRGRHGVHAAERELGQRFEVDVELGFDLGRAMVSDALQDTVDYRRAYGIVREEAEEQQYQLIEGLAGAIVRRLMAELPVISVLVRVRKPQVPLSGILSYTAVEIQRRR
jgi:7,8-dihydroneopterin aldolase/epimerase/oxygenase